jgi:hypothetical protein
MGDILRIRQCGAFNRDLTTALFSPSMPYGKSAPNLREALPTTVGIPPMEAVC